MTRCYFLIDDLNLNSLGPKCFTVERQTCIFPYKYGGKMYHSCYDGWIANWCPTSLNSDLTVKDWFYCTTYEDCSEKRLAGIPITISNKYEIWFIQNIKVKLRSFMFSNFYDKTYRIL